MRTWTRAAVTTLCGGRCGGTVNVGDPVQLVEVPGMRRKLIRCEQCADSQVPPDLPEAIVKGTVAAPSGFARFSRASVPKDFKALAAGKDR